MTVVTSGTLSVDFTQEPLYALPYGTVSSLSSTSYLVNWGNSPFAYHVTGTGFSDSNADGQPDTGTISSIQVYDGSGSMLFTISGIDRTVSDLYAINSYGLLDNILAGDDTINGSSAADNLQGFTGNDTINGNGGDDYLRDSDGGNDVLHGGAGNDTIDAQSDATAAGETQQVYGDGGDDTIYQAIYATTGTATYLVDGGIGNDNIQIQGYAFNNSDLTINGGDGNDVINFAVYDYSTAYTGTALTISGGAGFDELQLSAYQIPAGMLDAAQIDGIEKLTFTNYTSVTLSCEFLNQFQQIGVSESGLSLTLSDGGSIDLSAASGPLYVTASSEGDSITAGSGDDQLYGGAADDILRGGGGNDYIYGNAGSSTSGSDQMFGGDGDDTFYAYSSTSFVIDGGAGIDIWQGSANANDDTTDIVFDAAQAASATGLTLANGSVIKNVESIQVGFGAGNDAFFDNPGGGDDSVYLGLGNDVAHVSAGKDYLGSGAYANSHGSGGFDDHDTAYADYSKATAGLKTVNYIDFDYGTYTTEIFQGASWDTATLGVAAGTFDELHVIGSAFADQLAGGVSDDSFSGGAGDDTFTPEFGNDVIDGGSGSDSINFRIYSGFAVTGGTTIDLNLVTAQAMPTFNGAWWFGSDTLGTVTVSNIENIEGTAYADTFSGTSGANTLYGMGGDDVLDGRAGDDILRGGGGNDQLIGGDGNDTADYTGAIGSVTVALTLGGAQDTGGAGIDTLSSIENLIGGGSADLLKGSNAANVLSGAAGADKLVGYAGNDSLNGGTGNDRLIGGTGDDSYTVDSYNDVVIENAGEGTDSVFSSADFVLRANVEDLTLTGSANIWGYGNALDNALTGNAAANKLFGMDGNDVIDGSGGIDRMTGGTGNDTYYVDSYSDRVIESAGQGTDSIYASANYTLGVNVENLALTGTADLWAYGNTGNNALTGNSAANKLYGLAGSDTLSGGGGSDWLEGGTGKDTLTGGGGSDSFVFRDGDFGGATAATADRITDFSETEHDHIRLNLVDANTSLSGDQAFAFLGTAAFDGHAGELRYEQISGNTYVSGDTNGDGIADFMIRLDGSHTLASGDFAL